DDDAGQSFCDAADALSPDISEWKGENEQRRGRSIYFDCGFRSYVVRKPRNLLGRFQKTTQESKLAQMAVLKKACAASWVESQWERIA
ncbi:hypothetical protein LTR46_012128, partial [Exophiala xenobiotica]